MTMDDLFLKNLPVRPRTLVKEATQVMNFTNRQEKSEKNKTERQQMDKEYQPLGNILPKVNYNAQTPLLELWNQLDHTEQLIVLERLMSHDKQLAEKISTEAKKVQEERK